MAGHVSVELAAGVGLPLASFVGPVPAAAGFAVATGAVWRRTGSVSGPGDEPLAFWNGLNLAAALAHLGAWPRRPSRIGLPLLVDCEGLGPLLRGLDERDGRVQHIAVEDDDADAAGNGVRHVSMHVSVRRPRDLDQVVEEMARRPEILAVRVGAGETD